MSLSPSIRSYPCYVIWWEMIYAVYAVANSYTRIWIYRRYALTEKPWYSMPDTSRPQLTAKQINFQRNNATVPGRNFQKTCTRRIRLRSSYDLRNSLTKFFLNPCTSNDPHVWILLGRQKQWGCDGRGMWHVWRDMYKGFCFANLKERILMFYTFLV
jgi:hypothetical protein